jgi:3-deoxy-D-manno-octulosonic-acid transferase
MGSEIWRDRLGFVKVRSKFDLWLHAASVGEAKVAGYLADYLIHKAPNIRIYLTTMTISGHKIAQGLNVKNVTVGYFPIDSRGPVSRTLDNINPKVIAVAETEIWPVLIECASSKGIPIILINGRMSDKAFGRYKMASGLFEFLLAKYDRIFVKTPADKIKYASFGIDSKLVTIAGDMKFDAPLLAHDSIRVKKTRQFLGVSEKDFVLAAGSTRPGEERLLLQVLDLISKQRKRIHLVLAPRHLERLEEVKSEIATLGMSYSIYGIDNSSSPVILVDKMGQLDDIYLAADLAFVGGTLVDVGGHNVLEPVWAGTPVLFGPYISNIVESSNYVLTNNFGCMVHSVEEMSQVVAAFVDNRNLFKIKTEEELTHSPTATVGEYILQKLNDA